MNGNLLRRDPFALPALDRLFTAMLTDTPPSAMATFEEGSLALDISEDESHVIVRGSLPGFTKEQVHVEVHDGVLTIKAEKAEESEEKTERYYRKERRVGSLSRRVALPSVVQDEDAKAELKDGVLTLRLRKHAKATPRRISIH